MFGLKEKIGFIKLCFNRTVEGFRKIVELEKKVETLENQMKAAKYQRELMFWQIYKSSDENVTDAKLRFFRSLPKADGEARKSQLVMAALLQRIHETCEKNKLSYWLDFGTLIGAIRHEGFIPWDDDIDIGMMRSDAEKLVELLRNDPDVFVKYVFVNTKGNGIHRLCQVRWEPKIGNQVVRYMASIDIFIYDFCANISEANWNSWLELKRKLKFESANFPVKSVNTKILLQGDTQEQMKKIFMKHYVKFDEKVKVSENRTNSITFGFDNLCYSYGDLHMYKADVLFPLKKLKYEGREFYVPNQYWEYVNGVYGDILSLPNDILTHKHVRHNDNRLKALNILYENFVKNNNA